MEEVRATSAWVASHSSHVTVDSSGIEKVAERMKDSIPKVEWNFEGIHYFDNGPLTVQYLFVLDALNFCFWPDNDMSYDHLAAGLKEALQNDKSAFDADCLQKYTGPELRKMLKWPRPLPLEEERVRLLHEVGYELERSFDGKASKLVESCEKSASKLVALITSHFPGFRDHTVYKGHQVFLYKRAQIFAADLWGAFKGQGYGEFNDIESVTMFADYIVPAVLQQLGVLKYSPSLSNAIESNREISPGSEEEVELRACSVHAVEEIRELIHRKSGKQVEFYRPLLYFADSFSCTRATLKKYIWGFECGVGSLVMGFWSSMSFSSTSSNTLHILLSGLYNRSRLEGKSFLEFFR